MHHTIQNVNDLLEEHSTVGERTADTVAKWVGSWRFIIFQSLVLILWIIFNITGWVLAWDPYPFILMNLVLSTQAAFTAPILMMSQNRQSKMDRLEAHNDYLVNVKAAQQIELIIKQLEAQELTLKELHQMVEKLKSS